MNFKSFRSEVIGRIAALSRRERFLSMLVAGVVVYALFELLVFSPQVTRKNSILSSQHEMQSQLNALQSEIELINRRPTISPEILSLKQSELEQLKRQLVTLDAIAANTGSDAPRIGELVKDVLRSQQRNISLDSLKTLPVRTISAAPLASSNRSLDRSPSTQAAPPANLYRHGVEIELRGNYLDVLGYLRALEASSKAVFWSDVRMAKTSSADITLRVVVYMLSDQLNLRLS